MTYSDAWLDSTWKNVDLVRTLRKIKTEEYGNNDTADCLCDDCSLYWQLRCLPIHDTLIPYEIPERASSLQSARIVEAARRKEEVHK